MTCLGQKKKTEMGLWKFYLPQTQAERRMVSFTCRHATRMGLTAHILSCTYVYLRFAYQPKILTIKQVYNTETENL